MFRLNIKNLFCFKANKAFLTKRFCENTKSSHDKIKEEIIQLALINVKKYGWTENCLKISANELGYTNQITGIFREGPFELVNYTFNHWNNKLKKEIDCFNKEDKNLNLEDKIKKSIKLRLSYEIPFINNWSQAMNLGIQPQNIVSTSKKLYEIADIIVSQNTDNNLERESALLRLNIMKIFIISGTYKLHLLVDRSNDYVVTWKLIDTLWSFQSNFSKQFTNMFLVGDSFFKLIGYASISLLPYDFSKVDEMFNIQKDSILSER